MISEISTVQTVLALALLYLADGHSVRNYPAGAVFRRADSSNGYPANRNSIGLPFSSVAGPGSNAEGPFSSAAAVGDGPKDNGVASGPFASMAGTGNSNSGSTGSSGPFSASMGSENANGGAGIGTDGHNPFTAALDSSSGLNPFTSNMDGGFTSLMTSDGPGSVIGSNFNLNNSNMLMGHNFAKDLSGSGSGAVGDQSRFDTSEYQQMLNFMFSHENTDSNLQTLGNPFDGSGYNLPQAESGGDNTDHYNAAVETSVGGYASTDISSSNYGSYSGDATGQNPFHIANYNVGSGNVPGASYSSGTGSNSIGNDNSLSAGTHSQSSSDVNLESPFTIKNNIDTSNAQISSHSYPEGHNPFDTSKFNLGDSPFKLSDDHSGSSNGVNQSPFKTDGYQNSGATSTLFATDNSGLSYSNYNGLDAYGNVDFGKISDLSGSNYNSVHASTPFDIDSNQHYKTNPYMANTGTGSSSRISYSAFNTDSSNNRFETPFESENYNDLLDSPFQSGSAVGGGRQNYQGQFPNSAPNGISQPLGYHGNRVSSSGSGPGGDPFNQAGHSMGSQRMG